jgi:four helix bundle protein
VTFLRTFGGEPPIPAPFRAAWFPLDREVMAAADRFEDLVTWQRMYELSVEIWRATSTGPASRDFDYRNQIRDASDSTHRNVAEGFGRYSPAQFVQFLDISRASAEETRALLKKGLAVGHLAPDQFTRLDVLATRGLQALAKFQRYLRSPEGRRNAERSRYRKRQTDADRNANMTDPTDPTDPNDPNDPNDP